MIILRKQTIEERKFAKPGSFKNLVRKGKRNAGYWLTSKKECIETIPLGSKDEARLRAIRRLGKTTKNKRIRRFAEDLKPAFA